MAKSTAAPAAAGAAAPVATPKATKPAHHLPTPPRARDEFTGIGGTYMRDPATGVRTRVPPPAAAEGDDNTAAA
ncbi:hypothetical protein [Acidovorax sp. K2F]|uniref:hypothetical protein n=1 Tax=Acidovorax sp. K2F TaxID=2978125 RepID=UPI0021B0EF8E|nr:hypothetical protein [Acidovorax sp. K2F]MCT6721665.1 hypothetical protein [Acidovorax sp. K2F]